MMTKRLTGAVAVVVLLGVLVTWLKIGTVHASNESDKFQLGVTVCLTGVCAEWGNNSLKGIQLAVKEVNAMGGVLSREIELVVEDTNEGMGGTSVLSAYKKLAMSNDIKYLIGPSWIVGGMTLGPELAKKKDLIAMSPSLGTEGFNELSDNLFNVWPHDAYTTKALARQAIDQGLTKAAIISNHFPWETAMSDGFQREFESLGGEIVERLDVLPTETSFKTETARIKQANVDVVFFGIYSQIPYAAKKLRKLNYKGQMMGVLFDSTRITESDGALEGAIYSRYEDSTAKFVNSFSNEYGERPGIASDTAYDVVNLYAKAIGNAGSFDPETVKKELLQIKLNGASGAIKFDPKGGVIKEPELYVVRSNTGQPL